MRRWLWLILIIPAGMYFGFFGLVFFSLQPSISTADYEWEQTNVGYEVRIQITRAQTVCVCAGYTCPRNTSDGLSHNAPEPASLGYTGYFRHQFEIVKDPTTTPDWERFVSADLRCVAKEPGDTLHVMLKTRQRNISDGELREWLQLSIN